MKKTIYSLLTSLLIIAACSPAAPELPPPGETITAFFDLMQTGEYAEAQDLLFDGAPLPLNEVEEEFRGIFKNISYEIISEEVNGEEASVELNISATDFAAVMEEIMAEAFYWIFEGITENELANRIETMLLEKTASDTAPTTASYITVSLAAYEGQWQIVADYEFADAITGGLFSFAEYAGQWLN